MRIIAGTVLSGTLLCYGEAVSWWAALEAHVLAEISKLYVTLKDIEPSQRRALSRYLLLTRLR